MRFMKKKKKGLKPDFTCQIIFTSTTETAPAIGAITQQPFCDTIALSLRELLTSPSLALSFL